MATIDFNNSTLFISQRSPFARRVRLAFYESGIAFTERVYDVFTHNPDLIMVNPLGRVPALILKSGKQIIDSNFILKLFYESHVCPLNFRTIEESIEGAYWQALSVGLCEKSVEYFIDTLRPAGQRDFEIQEELKLQSTRIFEKLEEKAKENSSQFLVGNQLTQADLDVGAALAYFGLRFSNQWKEQYPNLNIYFNRLDQRPSFQKTRPLLS
jgi:glutathione S-transferase